MSLIKWEPLSDISRLHNEMDRLFDGVFGNYEPMLKFSESGRFVPSIDIYEKDGNLTVKAELPGVSKENIEIQTTKDSLTIQGHTNEDKEVKESGYYRRECRFGKFTRTIPLPENVCTDQIKASFKEGMLEIQIPKAKDEKPETHKIEIE